jgi:predicted pyridoxine 5'-phosphate oxidase superfamily flavin-nucleotide-binding protein
MPRNFQELAFTESVRRAQEHYGGRSADLPGTAAGPDTLGEEEAAFIRARDSFYLATVSESNWPYVQHRGGRPGFLHVLDARTLAYADYRGNRQMLSTGNLAVNDRVALFLMDYPRRERLKILGHARVEDARGNPDLISKLAEPGVRKIVERIFFIDVVAFDWNCSQHITPRFTAEDVREVIAPLQQRIAELEAKLAQSPG